MADTQAEIPPLDEIKEKLKADFEQIMLDEIGDKPYDNDKALEQRTTIMQKCTERVKEVTQMQYKFSLTVMVFEKTGYNRALSTVFTRKDGMVNAEYRGQKVYALVDAVLVKL